MTRTLPFLFFLDSFLFPLLKINVLLPVIYLVIRKQTAFVTIGPSRTSKRSNPILFIYMIIFTHDCVAVQLTNLSKQDNTEAVMATDDGLDSKEHRQCCANPKH